MHLYPAEVDRDPAAWAMSQGERHWATLCTRRRRDGRPVQSLPTVDALLQAMDSAGVERALLLGWYWEGSETCTWQNRFFAEVIRAHGDRLSACATFHPAAGRDAVLAEMQRARDDGLVGIGELSPHSQGYPVDDPTFRAALRLAAELEWPVNLHVTDPDGRPYPGRIETPLDDFVRLAREEGQTTFILAHWGGLLPLRDQRVLALRNIYYDTAASPLIYDAEIWQRFTAVVPSDRVLFGSDYPLNLYPRVSVEAEMARFFAEARAGGATPEVLGGNAERIFFGATEG
ncbi:MAG TPA: TatD family hydrolase [Opitutaceae bacterium]|nr:TatD family hydrolase [Opitutaceae bacterium]